MSPSSFEPGDLVLVPVTTPGARRDARQRARVVAANAETVTVERNVYRRGSWRKQRDQWPIAKVVAAPGTRRAA